MPFTLDERRIKIKDALDYFGCPQRYKVNSKKHELVACPTCGGWGKVYESPIDTEPMLECRVCDGKGMVYSDQEVNLMVAGSCADFLIFR